MDVEEEQQMRHAVLQVKLFSRHRFRLQICNCVTQAVLQVTRSFTLAVALVTHAAAKCLCLMCSCRDVQTRNQIST
jgi:hypothetical protein